MSKFVPFKFDETLQFPLEDKTSKSHQPKKVKQQTLDNIIAFSKAYSVRKSEQIEKMEFVLN